MNPYETHSNETYHCPAKKGRAGSRVLDDPLNVVSPSV